MRAGTAVEPALDQIIDRFFAGRLETAENLGGRYAELWRCAAEATQGGKRLRPRMLLLANDHLGGADRDSALIAAAAFEVLHTALLLHDDVLDHDLVRRGRPNLAGRFAAAAIDSGLDARDATTWGQASAVLAGDLLISGAHALVADITHPAARMLHRVIDDALLLTAAGEHADVGYARGVMAADQHDILRMIEQKTAAYSFAAPLRVGALLAGADEEAVTALERIGTDLGLLYQLRDDALGVFGVESSTGKSVIGDLREGKRTLLVAFAEGTAEWEAVRALFGRAPLEAEDADRLRAALLASGAVERMQQSIHALLAETLRRIADAPLPATLRAELAGVAERCAERQS
ncbi:polyprenyl synthetase family protein [Microbacterium sp. USHLN186]|uniref:polyprenyl synthetase family protein n=1 Tax=Microbacterium sp. USHLN186 TaxID=3081286 RepID=UPI003015E24D